MVAFIKSNINLIGKMLDIQVERVTHENIGNVIILAQQKKIYRPTDKYNLAAATRIISRYKNINEIGYRTLIAAHLENKIIGVVDFNRVGDFFLTYNIMAVGPGLESLVLKAVTRYLFGSKDFQHSCILAKAERGYHRDIFQEAGFSEVRMEYLNGFFPYQGQNFILNRENLGLPLFEDTGAIFPNMLTMNFPAN